MPVRRLRPLWLTECGNARLSVPKQMLRGVGSEPHHFSKGSFDMNDVMLRATLLTRANRLSEATVLIQRMLRGEPDPTVDSSGDVAPTVRGPFFGDREAASDEDANAAMFDFSRSFGVEKGWPYRAGRVWGAGLPG